MRSFEARSRPHPRRQTVYWSLVTASDIETSLPHLTSLTNLRELIIGCPDIARTSLGVLTPIFSSSPGILKLHWWTSWDTDVHDTLKNISPLADLLLNLTHVTLSGYQNRCDKVELLADEEFPSAIRHFSFHKLRIYYDTYLFLPFFESCGLHPQILDLSVFSVYHPGTLAISLRSLCKTSLIPITLTEFIQDFRRLLEACHTLQVLNFGLDPRTAEYLDSIPSSSVSVVHISNPLRIGTAPMTYSDSWPWESFEEFEHYRSRMDNHDPEVSTHLGVSIQKIGQRYSDHHSGLKTRVRATFSLMESEVQAVENGETPFYKARLEEELKDHVDFELILVAFRLPPRQPRQPESEVESESNTDGSD